MAGYVAPTDPLEKSEEAITLRLHVELVYDPECPNVDAARRDDVAPGPHPWAHRDGGDGPRCRIYREGSTVSRAPPEHRVAEAVQAVLGPDVV
jgi:hypothetical protein